MSRATRKIMIAMPPSTVQESSVTARRPRAVVLLVAAAIVAVTGACAGGSPGGGAPAEPWGTSTVTPAEFAKELESAREPDKPIVVCVAPPFMYRVGHVPGAVLHGPASSPEGLSGLMTWAQALPRSANLVVYCGCCPLSQCPNVRPAYAALKDLGFTRVRLLLIEDNFKTDWIDRGHPFER